MGFLVKEGEISRTCCTRAGRSHVQDVTGGIVTILGGGSIDYSQ